MFDANIQAVVVREIQTNEKPIKIISIDEKKQLAVIEIEKGENKQVKITKPIARAMMFLGSKNNQGVFILQRNYSQSGVIDAKLARELEEQTLDKFIKTLNTEHNLNLRKMQKNETGIKIPGSHNPAGHYNDLVGARKGENGEEYEI